MPDESNIKKDFGFLWKKNFYDPVRAYLTIGAIIIGGFWTYDLYIEERAVFPHANIEQEVSHLLLPNNVSLLRVDIQITNIGKSLISIIKSDIRVQQILPFLSKEAIDPSAEKQIEQSLKSHKRQKDHYDWPLLAKREKSWENSIHLEPGEKQRLDFEFAIPANIEAIRVYSHFTNEGKREGADYGWSISSYYDLRGNLKDRTK